MDFVGLYSACFIILSHVILFFRVPAAKTAELAVQELAIAVFSLLLWLPVFGRIVHWW